MMSEIERLMQDLPPRLLLAAVILNDAYMFDEQRLRLLKAASIDGDPVEFARHMVKLNAALRRPERPS
jgi:hypothetical protein